MIKAVIFDFDGTLVTKDILDVVCGILGKEKESEQINNDFHAGILTGLMPLITRINLLKGVTLAQIKKKLDEDSYLTKGAEELMLFLKNRHIVTILSSGNIIPVLLYYQQILGIDYIVGTKPQMDRDTILGITQEDFHGKNFKVEGVREILGLLQIDPQDTLAVGDSPADKMLFAFAGTSVAINAKNGVEQFATYNIQDDLAKVIPIIEMKL
jgi:HAD superfamily phosphoserine phosphatase-like hydrolase